MAQASSQIAKVTFERPNTLALIRHCCSGLICLEVTINYPPTCPSSSATAYDSGTQLLSPRSYQPLTMDSKLFVKDDFFLLTSKSL